MIWCSICIGEGPHCTDIVTENSSRLHNDRRGARAMATASSIVGQGQGDSPGQVGTDWPNNSMTSLVVHFGLMLHLHKDNGCTIVQ